MTEFPNRHGPSDGASRIVARVLVTSSRLGRVRKILALLFLVPDQWIEAALHAPKRALRVLVVILSLKTAERVYYVSLFPC